MLPIALCLAAAPVYIDTTEPQITAEAEPLTTFRQLGITASAGGTFALPSTAAAGVFAGLGVRYGMRPPDEHADTYWTPDLSVRLEGGYATSAVEPYVAPLDGNAKYDGVHGAHGMVGVDVRVGISIARLAGMFAPAFSAWVSTGSGVMFNARGAQPTSHVGLGLGIDFVREVTPAVANKMFGSNWLTDYYRNLGNGGFSGGGGGLVALALAVLLGPLIIVGGMCAILAGSAAVTAANLELRYMVNPTPTQVVSYPALVVGVGF